MLNIDKKTEGKKLVFKLSGRLDTTTAPELETEVKGHIDGVENLEFDFADLEYISSAGLRVLLTSQKTMNKQGNTVVKNRSDEMIEIFDVI